MLLSWLLQVNLHSLANLSSLNSLFISMSMSHKIDTNVLVGMDHIKVALQIIPHIVGPKEDWEPWMWDNLKVEEVCSSVFEVKVIEINVSHCIFRGKFLKWAQVLHTPGFLGA